MATDIRTMTRDIERRLQDLRPLIEERDRLEAAQAVLANRATPAGARVPPRPRAARGTNRRAILAAVQECPGITSAQIAKDTGIARTTVYSTVAQLKREGVVASHQKGYVAVRRDYAGDGAGPGAGRQRAGAQRSAQRERTTSSDK